MEWPPRSSAHLNRRLRKFLSPLSHPLSPPLSRSTLTKIRDTDLAPWLLRVVETMRAWTYRPHISSSTHRLMGELCNQVHIWATNQTLEFVCLWRRNCEVRNRTIVRAMSAYGRRSWLAIILNIMMNTELRVSQKISTTLQRKQATPEESISESDDRLSSSGVQWSDPQIKGVMFTDVYSNIVKADRNCLSLF